MLPEIMMFNGWTSLEQIIDYLKNMNLVLESEFTELQETVKRLEIENEMLRQELKTIMEGTENEQSC